MTRRELLRGVAAAGICAVVASDAFAQAAYTGPPPNPNNTSLTITSGGIVVVPPTIGNVNLTSAQQRTLSQMANEFFRSGMSRKKANITLSAVVRAFCQTMSEKGFLGVLTAAGVGGAYNLATTGNPTYGVLNLSAGNEALSFQPVECASTPYTAGNYPDSVTMGWYRNDRTCSTSTAYGFRISVINGSSATGSGNPGGTHQWSWAYTQNMGVTVFGQRYKHFYTTQFGSYNPNVAPIVIPIGSGLDAGAVVPSAAKSEAISCELLNALKWALWRNAQSSGNWSNFKGYFMEPTGNGTWESQDGGSPVAPPTSFTPACASFVGSPVTVADLLERPTVKGGVDPGNVEYPADAKFPGEPGYTGTSPTPGGTPTPTPGGTPTPTPGSTPTPTPSPTPTPTDPTDSGGCQAGGSSWWEFWKPNCEPAMVEADAAPEAPKIDVFTSAVRSTFDPINSKLAQGDVTCPAIPWPKVSLFDHNIFPTGDASFHCQLIEPHRTKIVGALGVVGTWKGIKMVMEA